MSRTRSRAAGPEDRGALIETLFLRLFGVLEMRDTEEPDPERTEIVRRLRPMRNKLVHAEVGDEDRSVIEASIPELLEYLRLIEGSSLGGSKAQYLRLLSTAQEISTVLALSARLGTGRRADRPARPREADGTDGQHEDDPLVTAAVHGDRQAVERLLERIRPMVLRYCRARVGRIGRSFATADDVCQEVLLGVITALPNYRDQGRPFLAFVYGIAAHKVADSQRRDTAPDLAGGELPELALTMFRALPDKQREIVVLRVAVGLSAEDTAKAIGSTPGAVRVAQHRALTKLRALDDAERQAATSR